MKKTILLAQPYEYYRNHIRFNNEISSKIFHPKTRYLFDTILVDIKVNGINEVVKLHKSGRYKKIYETDEEFCKKGMQDHLSTLVNTYYKTWDEKIIELDSDIRTIHKQLLEFIGPQIDTIYVKRSFYNYLAKQQILDCENEEYETDEEYIIKKDSNGADGFWLNKPIKIDEKIENNFKIKYIGEN